MADTKPISLGSAPAGVQLSAPAPPLELHVARQTDVGRARPHNEDYVDYRIPHSTRQLTHKGSIFLVADGMGGHQAGEVASQGAVSAVMEEYYDDSGQDVPSSLLRAFRSANEQLYRQAQTDPSKAGMGTTLVAAVVLERALYVANVGDSRAYLLNRQGMTQITEDHSWVEEQVRAGLLTEEQARRHPQRHLVTRALGSKPSVEVDTFVGEISTGDKLLLCSDGLTNRMSDSEISAIVGQHAPEEAARLLVAEANERGGNDNITVLIVSAQEELVPARALALPASVTKAGRRLSLGPILLGLVTLLLIAAGSLYAWIHFQGDAPQETPALPSGTAIVAPHATGPVVGEAQGTVTSSSATAPLTGQSSTPQATQQDLTPAATATADLPEAPVTLGNPEVGARLTGVVHFTWTHHGSLGPSEAFQVLIWRADQENGFLHMSEPLRQESYQHDLEGLLPQDSAEDEFLWSVRIVGTSNSEPLTNKAPHRSFIYRRTGG